jgi:rhodanese-related sulfurtransferase
MTLPRPLDAPRRRAALLGLFAAAALAGCREETIPLPSVSLEQARAEHEAGRAILIDIREPSEHANGVAAGATLLPMSQIAARLAEIPTDPGKPVLLICNTQNRSSATLRQLRERAGYAHLSFVEGGMSEWVRRGWPVVPPGR